MPEPLLDVRGIDAFYGDFQALFGIDFRVEAGETVAIIGSNGAGKSTFLRSVTGMIANDPETIRWDGEPIGGLPANRIVARGIAMVPEGRRLFPSLTVEENLLMGAYAKRPGPWTLPRVYGLFPVLEERRRVSGIQLSGGQQQMLAIGRAMASKPSLLLLDEPSMGLAPIFVNQIFELIVELNEQGTTILVVEQNANLALEIADRAYVLDGGRTVLSGTAEEIMNNEAVTAAYLGA